MWRVQLPLSEAGQRAALQQCRVFPLLDSRLPAPYLQIVPDGHKHEDRPDDQEPRPCASQGNVQVPDKPEIEGGMPSFPETLQARGTEYDWGSAHKQSSPHTLESLQVPSR